jgi:hypothetical protein
VHPLPHDHIPDTVQEVLLGLHEILWINDGVAWSLPFHRHNGRGVAVDLRPANDHPFRPANSSLGVGIDGDGRPGWRDRLEVR